MASDLDRRAYDILYLIARNEPIGSISLVEMMKNHGYSIEGRTVRLTLSDLDDKGLTTKVPGRGRKLTDKGRTELQRGDISARTERVRETIEILKNEVTYDPVDQTGRLVTGVARIDPERTDEAFRLLERLHHSQLGPCLVSVSDSDDGPQLTFPSSITIDGVLLSHGISSTLKTAALADYHPDPDPNMAPHSGEIEAEDGGAIVRYIDAISGEGSTMDVVRLLIESGRTASIDAIDGRGKLIVDNREVPLNRQEEIVDLVRHTRADIGGVIDIRRPREDGPFPTSRPGWDFLSLTHGGIAEIAISVLAEADLLKEWKTLDTVVSRQRFDPSPVARENVSSAGSPSD